MSKINYTIPIIVSTVAEAEKMIKDHISSYSFLEIWLDYITDLNTESLASLISLLNGQGIFLFRRKNLEHTILSQGKRFEFISLLTSKNCLIDLDLTSQLEELDYLHSLSGSKRLISSYHNYSHTPTLSELHSLLSTMERYSPEIFKFSALCNDPEDALRLLQFQLELKEQKLKHIVLGMGEHGVVTRIFGTIWGNELVFAPLSKDSSSAPGQLSKVALEAIFKNLS
jgi:3-dehydroquinate dehydratase-1